MQQHLANQIEQQTVDGHLSPNCPRIHATEVDAYEIMMEEPTNEEAGVMASCFTACMSAHGAPTFGVRGTRSPPPSICTAWARLENAIQCRAPSQLTPELKWPQSTAPPLTATQSQLRKAPRSRCHPSSDHAPSSVDSIKPSSCGCFPVEQERD